MDSNIINIAEKWLKRSLDLAMVEYEDNGIEENIKLWGEGKEGLYQLLRKSPDWDESTLSVIKTVAYSRKSDKYARVSAFDSLLERVERYLDNNNLFDAMSYLEIIKASYNGTLSYPKTEVAKELVETDEELTLLKEVIRMKGIQKGMKYSRLIQKLLKSWDANIMSDDGIARKYDAWVDAITAQSETYDLVVSINPADYVLMSYGNSWCSCHIINPAIARGSNAYEGQYKSGTLSYMVDVPTVIAYLLPSGTRRDDFNLTPKIARQVFFFKGNGKHFYQSRLYPGGEQGMEDLFRDHVKALLSDINGETEKRWENCVSFRLEQQDYLHYPDYNHRENGINSWSVLGEYNSSIQFSLGSRPMCLMCGNEFIRESDTLYCGSCRDDNEDDENWVHCAECGEGFNCEDDGYRVGDDWICNSCYSDNYGVCERCNDNFHTDDLFTDPDGNYLCSECFNDRCFTCDNCDEPEWIDNGVELGERCYCVSCAEDISGSCYECGEIVENDKLITFEDEHYCPDCIGEHAVYCDHCGTWKNEDDMHEVAEKMLCNDCVHLYATLCEECSEWIKTGTLELVGEELYCPSCAVEKRMVSTSKDS